MNLSKVNIFDTKGVSTISFWIHYYQLPDGILFKHECFQVVLLSSLTKFCKLGF